MVAKKMNPKQRFAVFFIILTSLLLLNFLSWGEELANLENDWTTFQQSLPADLPRFKLTDSMNTAALLAKQKDVLAALTQEPFLVVNDFDYTAAIEQRILEAKKNIIALKDTLATLKTAASKFQEAAFNQRAGSLQNLEEKTKETINANLQLFPEIFKIYLQIDQEGGTLEEMAQEIENLKSKEKNQLKTRQEKLGEFASASAPLLKIIAEKNLLNADEELLTLGETSEIKEFVELINNWFSNPQQPMPADKLIQVTDKLADILDDESILAAADPLDRIYLTEKLILNKFQQPLDTAGQLSEQLVKSYKDYNNFFTSGNLSFILDENINYEDLRPHYLIDGRQIAKGWQPEGTWNYPLIYQLKGVRDKLFSVENKEPALEIVNVDDTVLKLLPKVRFLTSKENETLVAAFHKLQDDAQTAKKIRDTLASLVNLLRENDEKEKVFLQEKNAAIDKLTADAVSRFQLIRQEIKEDKYIKTSSNDFQELLRKEIQQIEKYKGEVFLIQTNGLRDKVKEAETKLETLAGELFNEYLARCACQYEEGYNKELAAKIAEISPKFDALLKLTDKQKLTKEFTNIQAEFRNLKKGNIKHTETGETLTLQRSAANETALSKLEESLTKARYFYYKNTTAPSLTGVKLDNQEITAAQIVLPPDKAAVEISGSASLVYAAMQNGFSIQKVEYSLDEGKTFTPANGKETWNIHLTFTPEEEKSLIIQAADSAGTPSPVVKIKLISPQSLGIEPKLDTTSQEIITTPTAETTTSATGDTNAKESGSPEKQ